MINDISLSLTLARRELESKYRGSILGIFWLLLNPVLLLSLYSFIFQYVFSAKWHVDENTTNYTVALFCGLVPFFFISDMLGKGTELIRGNSNLVKKVVFNKLTLPISSTLSSSLTLLINLTLLLAADLLFNDGFSTYKLLVYAYLFPIMVAGYTVCTICACVGIYFRDFSNIIAFINPVLMFTSPIFFSLSSVSDKFGSIIKLNPLTYMIDGLRSIIINNIFDFENFISVSFIGILCSLAASYIFNKLKEDFSDLI